MQGYLQLHQEWKKELKKLKSLTSKKYLKKFLNFILKRVGKNIYSIFPNSKLTKPSTAKLNNVDELYLNVLKQFIENIAPKSKEGTCIACGTRESLKTYNKTFVPLTSSGSLKNYFSFANDGAGYCPLCVLLIQFHL